MSRKSFSYSGALGFGWRVMAANFWFFAGVWVVSFFVPYFVSFFVSLPGQILGQLAGRSPKNIPPFPVYAILTASLINFIVNIITGIGIIKITLSFCDGVKPRFSTLFTAWRGCFWRYIGAGLLYILIIVGTSMACILPFAFLSNLRTPFLALPIAIVISILLVTVSIKFSLWFYFVIDKGLGPINALKASNRATEGAKLSLFVFEFVCGLIISLGALCFLVGLFATVPMIMVTMALVYRQLSEQTPELAELGIGGPSAKPGAGGSTHPFSGMQPNPIIPSIQSIQSGPSIRAVGGVQPTQSVRAGESTRPAPGIQPEGKKKSSSPLGWIIVLVVCVAIAAGIGYYFLARSKNKIAVSLKDAAVSLKDAAVSSNKVALKGILYSEDKPSALIGEKIVTEGDIVNGVKVIKINKDTVEFEKDGVKWTQRTK